MQTATSAICFDELRTACVGGEVHYPDGSVAHIMSGAGFAAIDSGRPVAITISNGDVIAESLQSRMGIVIRDGLPPIPGFRDLEYVPPQRRQ
ncbi:hypothetical protein [Trinickia fusca]|uniref:hypothetical protein n=1 Tax=Trinickia fusca TaxID=2419777 RepID=UPI0011C41211|nr:hypothetical protein [Trinickia fusca]